MFIAAVGSCIVNRPSLEGLKVVQSPNGCEWRTITTSVFNGALGRTARHGARNDAERAARHGTWRKLGFQPIHRCALQ